MLSTSTHFWSTRLTSQSLGLFSKINLCYTYYLVHIADSDEWKTAFRICYRSFEWSIIHFSFINTPTAFQQFMNNIFSNLLDVCIVIYLNNILIYLNNMSEHHWHVKEVLKHFYKAAGQSLRKSRIFNLS